MKKIIIIVLCILMVSMSAAGCTTESYHPNKENSENMISDTPDINHAQAYDPVKVTYTTEGKETKLIPDENAKGELTVSYHNSYYYKDQVMSAGRKFEEMYPNVKLTVDHGGGFTYDDYKKKITTDIMAGTGTDIFYIAASEFNPGKVMRAGALADMHDYFENDQYFNIDDYNKAVFCGGQPEGEQYIIPVAYDFPLLISTKKMIEKSGFDISKCTDYLACMKEIEKLVQSREESLTVGNVYCNPMTINCFPGFTGIKWIDHDALTVNVDNYEFKKSFEFSKINFPGLITGNGVGLSGSGSDIIKGWMAGTAVIADYAQMAYREPVNLARFATTIGDEPIIFANRNINGKISASSTECVAVRNNSDNKENAYNFIKILISPEIQAIKNYTQFAVPISTVALKERLYDNQEVVETYSAELGGTIDLAPLSDEFIEQYLGLIDEIDDMDYDFYYGSKLLRENMLPYFKDEKSYDECIKNAQEALEIYVSE